MIKIKDVCFSYALQPGDGGEALTLKNINLEIETGECILVCGKSGSGKTTLIKLINGLIPHFYENCRLTGCVTVNGVEVAKTDIYKLAEFVGSVFQNPKSQFFNTDSDAELAFGLENAGKPVAYMKQRIEHTVKFLGIEKLLERNVFAMSGGEKQNLAFASIYAMNPDIYVLDEPTANLDRESIEVLRQLIKKIKEEGKTIIIAEHRFYFLADLIDRAVYMEQGQVTRTFKQREFIELTETQRIGMGLRTLQNTVQVIPGKKTITDKRLIVKDLSLAFGKKNVFRGLSFSAGKGEILGITGKNGSGKSTLFRCLAGLIQQTSGKITLDDCLLGRKKRNRAFYMIMQDINHQLFSDSLENECRLSCASENIHLIHNILREFNLDHLSDSHPMVLSGGQKQRLAIATAILGKKKVILFDEPTSGLDFKHMKIVSRMIKNLAAEHVILIATHDQELIDCTCDRTVSLSGL